MGNIVAKFDIDKLFEGVYAKVEDIQDAVIQAIELACLDTVKMQEIYLRCPRNLETFPPTQLYRRFRAIARFYWVCYIRPREEGYG